MNEGTLTLAAVVAAVMLVMAVVLTSVLPYVQRMTEVLP